MCIYQHFALVYERLLGLEKIFDGIFDGHDMFHALLIDDLDQGRQGRRLALTDWANDKEKSLRLPRERQKYLGQIQLLDGAYLFWYQAKRHGYGTSLKERITAEAESVPAFICEIYLLVRFEAFHLLCREKRL